ncbi:MAG: ATP-binding protein [Woronichinia naegeliana WA131]|jgi:predicted ATP-dependent endonuclease of OLD family|uniref:ATP-binding protein n=1 Tax=Woronichinia naegeliana WA131 TaxID=2824559 RepID=A0A977KT62_9CYAN|nr:MAG: ATP-binding protein [Woronichinia naegeliana WA131]UXE61242.1 MAG: ATP-binding protein [Woronichinia naegeliana WA131]
MHLQRVQVPDFRVLKDIDISFEKEFSPRIFPLGSLNGGGKSTLLQLIFILLHCSADPQKYHFIRNLLEDFTIPKGTDQRTLAKFEIANRGGIIGLEYLVFLGSSFSALYSTIENKTFLISESIGKEQSFASKPKYILDYNNYILAYRIIQAYLTTVNEAQDQSTNIDFDKSDIFLDNLSKKVFLASPSTQIFLFLSKKYRKSRFKSNKTLENQEESSKKQDRGWEWDDAKNQLTNFFPYDFVSVDILIQSFKQARDKDFEEAIETGGHYGKHYQNLLNDFNKFLKDKQINLDKDLSGVNFKAERNGETIELYPEDLSHGELKRLSLYVWLKYSNIENAIILFDEIEIALHPDWQYQIIRDLEEWGPTNQYILATHSYELCQALTPAHVKEIEPKLLNNVNHS